MKGIFIDKTYLLAFVLDFKKELFNEYSVSFNELYHITKALNEEFESNNLNVRIIDTIDNRYYETTGDIRLKNGYTTEKVKSNLLSKIDVEDFSIIFEYLDNKDLMANIILESKQQIINDAKQRYGESNINVEQSKRLVKKPKK